MKTLLLATSIGLMLAFAGGCNEHSKAHDHGETACCGTDGSCCKEASKCATCAAGEPCATCDAKKAAKESACATCAAGEPCATCDAKKAAESKACCGACSS